MNFCPTCGGQLPARAQFCPTCGERLESLTQPAAVAPAPPAAEAAAPTQGPRALAVNRAPRVQYSKLEELAPFPTFGSRVAAWLIDLGVIGGLIALAGVLGGGIVSSAKDSYGNTGPGSGSTMAFGTGVILFFLAAAVLYLPLCDGSGKGQTLGKHFLGIRVVRARDGQPLTLAHGFGRFLARVADIYSIGLLWAAADRYGRAFHDHLATTVVVDARRFPPPAPHLRAKTPVELQPAEPANTVDDNTPARV